MWVVSSSYSARGPKPYHCVVASHLLLYLDTGDLLALLADLLAHLSLVGVHQDVSQVFSCMVIKDIKE
jgi:hypothetical protein